MGAEASTLADRRRELLRRRIAEKGLAAESGPDQTQAQAGQHYPLSDGQRRMWFLQSKDPADTTLNVCVAYRLTGTLDIARLRGAVDDVVARHSILRTTYGVDAAGEPFQVFRDGVEIPWQEIDLSSQDGGIESLADEQFGTPFDLAVDLPLRITLIRTGADDWVLLLAVHHICWDDECFAVFFADLTAAYAGRADTQVGQFVAVSEPAGESEPTDVEYWRTVLLPVPEVLELPGVSKGDASRAAHHRNSAVSDELFSRAEAFARQRSASPFMVLLAAFGALIRRYTGAADFLVSIPVTARPAAAQHTIGYFGNTLLLRLRVKPTDTFASLVDAVRDTCIDGFAHQSVGIDRVVREINPTRAMGRDGMEQLVRLGFSLRKSANALALDGVDVTQLEFGAVTAQLPLSLSIDQGHDGVRAEFEYQNDVLSDDLVGQMSEHYLTLLTHLLDAPDRRLGAVDMLGAEERADVLSQSHGQIADTAATTIVACLEATCAANPDASALVSDATTLSYAELHGRSNRLARWMVSQGIGPAAIVGLRMTTSVEFVVAMLAVLKTGAAYFPIDPAYPPDRIAYLMADAGPTQVYDLEQIDAAEAAAAGLDDAMLTDHDRTGRLHPDHLAYVIYTSGSTGQPKGVAVSHRAIADHVQNFIAEWSMTAEDRLLQSSSVSFDASLLDLFVTLTVGAQLIVPKPDAFSDIPYVTDLISRHDVTVLHMVPSMLATLLLLPEVRAWRQLRHVPVGGEALSWDVAAQFADHFDASLRNHYGPTEAVVCSTHMAVDGSSRGPGVVPIGLPNRNVYAYVLDADLQLTPAGAVGELYLGGTQLAQGYLGRPALTAQRFVADPFNPGQRLYRSGDLVRRNRSGVLDFIGRADEQVKVRGFRIELGEIESVLTAHPAVRHCVVVADDNAGSGGTTTTLIGYVVPTADHDDHDVHDLDSLAGELRDHVAAALPEYMVPSAFGVISEIPLTVSGKLDRDALPAATGVAARSFREPATEFEQRMCALFCTLFDGERIGADDSFFDLGGHSLLAVRLVAAIATEFGVQLTARAVFDAPTPAGLAARIAGSSAGTPRPALVAVASTHHPALSYSQLAMWFQHRMRGANDVFNLALSLRFDGPDSSVLLLLVHHIVTDHASLGVMFEELAEAYRARTADRAPSWDRPSLQFADYATWQHEVFATESPWGQGELTHWQTALAGLPSEIPIAADYARPMILGTQAHIASFVASADLRSSIVRVAERTDASEFMVYQGALALVLHALGGGTDIAIGSPVSARVDASTERLCGPMANVIVLRNDLTGDPTLGTLVARSRETVLDALEHQELPTDRLVEAINPPRSTSRNHPLFQTSLHFRGDDWALAPQPIGSETTVTPMQLDFEVSLLDLNIGIDVTADGGLDVRVVANADLYQAETARHIADALLAALTAFATAPDTALSAVQLLDPAVLERLRAAPAAARAATTEHGTVPVDGSPETEQALIGILEELLEIDDVDREDNFFALGGDSIIAVQLAARASAEGLALTPLMVFEHVSIAALAGAVDAGLGLESDMVAVADPSVPQQPEPSAPMSASGLSQDALADLSAAWLSRG